MQEEKEEPSPILKKWRNVYFLVIGTEAVVIILLYMLTQYF
jgi:hypothetical protein